VESLKEDIKRTPLKEGENIYIIEVSLLIFNEIHSI